MIERISQTPFSTSMGGHPSLVALLSCLSPSHLSALESMVAHRAAGHPLQYLLGDTPFCSLSFLCRPPTLIPRPETEQMTDWLIHTLTQRKEGYEGSDGWPTGLEWSEKRGGVNRESVERESVLRVLDVCSGSGCIGLSLAAHLHCWTVGVDVADSALSLARDNVAHVSTQLPSPLTRSTFISGDILSPDFPALLSSSHRPFDVLVSNPPYIPRAVVSTLQREIVEHEDPRALIGGEDGLAFYSALVRLAKKVVRRGREGLPEVVLEIGGKEQVQAVTAACVEEGFSDVRVYTDHSGRQRWIAARREG